MSIKDFTVADFDTQTGLTLGESKVDEATDDAQSKAQGMCGTGLNCTGGGGQCGTRLRCAGG